MWLLDLGERSPSDRIGGSTRTISANRRTATGVGAVRRPGQAGILTLFEGSEHPRQQTRILNNLGYVLEVIHPRQALGAKKRGLELARQMGLRDREIFLALAACEGAIGCGDWKWARETLASLSDADMPAVFAIYSGSIDAKLAALQGQQARAEERLRRVQPIAESITSPRDKGAVTYAEAVVSLAGGELEAAFDKAMLAAAMDPTGSSAFVALGTAGAPPCGCATRGASRRQLSS